MDALSLIEEPIGFDVEDERSQRERAFNSV
jgi:hypothetical protein